MEMKHHASDINFIRTHPRTNHLKKIITCYETIIIKVNDAIGGKADRISLVDPNGTRSARSCEQLISDGYAPVQLRCEYLHGEGDHRAGFDEAFYMKVAGLSNITNRTCKSMDGINLEGEALPLCAFEPLLKPNTCNSEEDSTMTFADAQSACSKIGARLCNTADLIGNPFAAVAKKDCIYTPNEGTLSQCETREPMKIRAENAEPGTAGHIEMLYANDCELRADETGLSGNSVPDDRVSVFVSGPSNSQQCNLKPVIIPISSNDIVSANFCSSKGYLLVGNAQNCRRALGILYPNIELPSDDIFITQYSDRFTVPMGCSDSMGSGRFNNFGVSHNPGTGNVVCLGTSESEPRSHGNKDARPRITAPSGNQHDFIPFWIDGQLGPAFHGSSCDSSTPSRRKCKAGFPNQKPPDMAHDGVASSQSYTDVCSRYTGEVSPSSPSPSFVASSNAAPGNTRYSGQAMCSRYISTKNHDERTDQSSYPDRQDCTTHNVDGDVWSARGSCLCEKDRVPDAPIHFTFTSGYANGRRMCRDYSKKSDDIYTSEACETAVRNFMLAIYNQQMADEIVFGVANEYDNTIPYGCSVNLDEKKAYFRGKSFVSLWTAWDLYYKQREWAGIIPDNSCTEMAFNGA